MGAIIFKALEVLFISVAMVLITLLMMLKLESVFSTPLYVCLAINFMVVLIAVSSTFHGRESDHGHEYLHMEMDPVDDAGILEPPPPQNITTKRKCTKLEKYCVEKETVTCDGGLGTEVHEIEKPPLDSLDSMMEENRVVERVKEIDVEVESLDTENEQEDSIEATWNAITGGGTRKPKKKQLKKSETWDVPLPPVVLNTTTYTMHRLDSEEILPTTPRWKELRKSETFNDAVSVTRRGGLIRKDPSMTLEEFNQRVDAFIKKFNHEMRLQRQESDQRFLDMINNRPL